MLVKGYVLLAFGEIACNTYTLLLLLLLNVLKNRQYLKNVYIKNNGMVVRPLCLKAIFLLKIFPGSELSCTGVAILD